MSTKAEHYDVIRKPIITEKATMASESNAVVFEVAIGANKPQIKEAVESLFGVKVKAVNTTITKGKVKRFRGQLGTRKDVKSLCYLGRRKYYRRLDRPLIVSVRIYYLSPVLSGLRLFKPRPNLFRPQS